MMQVTAVWRPEWYELDQALTVGEVDDFLFITSCSPPKFATGFEQGEFRKAKVLAICNKELGDIVRIDTQGLSYKFYSADDNFIQIEAEETPGKFETGDKSGQYLADNRFIVAMELL